MDDLSEEEMIALAIAESLIEQPPRSSSPPLPPAKEPTQDFQEEFALGGSEQGTCEEARRGQKAAEGGAAGGQEIADVGVGTCEEARRGQKAAEGGAGGGQEIADVGVGSERAELGRLFKEVADDGQAARLEGTGWEGCDNEDDAITGHPLRELAPERVVRFDVSARRPHCGTHAGLRSEEAVSGKGGEEEAKRGWEGASSNSTERGGSSLRHGYDAVYLARWLSRDQRLPLTFHAVSEEDCLEVLRIMRCTASTDEVEMMLDHGELIRDIDTGELRPNNAQGPATRLVDGEGEFECLDWQYFLGEIDRLSAQIIAARNQMMLDRGYGKKADEYMRIQALSELQVRVDARRSQLTHITTNFDASEILADLYQMQETVKNVRNGAPLHLNDPLSPLVSRQKAPQRLSAHDAEDYDPESDEEFEYEHVEVAYGGKVKQRSSNYKVSSSKAGVRARW